MPDYSAMSNEDLLRLYQGNAATAAPPPSGGDMASKSTEELLRAYQGTQQPGGGSLNQEERAAAGGGAMLRGIPVLGAYVPQAEAAIRAAMNPITGVGQPGETYAQRYAANLPERQQEAQTFDVDNPITSEALKILGGTAALAPVGATAAGARAMGWGGGGLLSRMGYGATGGAALGAADAAARGENIEAGAKGGVLGGAGGAVLGRVLGRAPRAVGGTEPLTAKDIKDAGSEMYNLVRKDIAGIDIPMIERTQIRNGFIADLNVDFRKMRAPETHAYAEQAVQAKDATDLVNLREKVSELGRNSEGNERAAAYLLRNKLDGVIDQYKPGISERLKWADQNYAIANKAEKFEDDIKRAQIAARGSPYGAREGTALRKLTKPMLDPQAQFVSPGERAAAENLSSPGAGGRTLQTLSMGDPSRRGFINTMLLPFSFSNPISAAAHVGTMTTGYGAGKAYDALMRSRAAELSRAIRREAPATLAQSGYQPPQMVPGQSWLASAGIPFGLGGQERTR